MAAVLRALVIIMLGALIITAGDVQWRSCQSGSWKLLSQSSSTSCIEFWLNRYQTFLAGLAALLAAWITINAIRHHTETARVDEAERALNQYAAALLDLMQKYEAVPLALSHETRQDAERQFQALNDATDAPTIRTAMMDSPPSPEAHPVAFSGFSGGNHMDQKLQNQLEAAVFKRLVEHFRTRTDVQNIDLMELAGFCRNCLSNWYQEAAQARGLKLSKDEAKEIVYGMPYNEWKDKFQTQRNSQ
jgi:uncharacterized protein